MNQDTEELVKRCSECRTHLPVKTKEPLQQPLLPTRPWDKLGQLGNDLYSLNDREYLIVTDYFSSLSRTISPPEVYDLGKDVTAPAPIKELTQLFSRFGQPVARSLQRLPKIGILYTLYHLPPTLNLMAKPKQR